MNEKILKKAINMTKKVVNELNISGETAKVDIFRYISKQLVEDKLMPSIYIPVEEPIKKKRSKK